MRRFRIPLAVLAVMTLAGLGSQLVLSPKRTQMNIVIEEGVAYDVNTGSPANGIRELFHHNGLLQVRGEYVEGRQEGLWQIFYGNGKLKESGHFENGEQVGQWKFFHKDGRLKEKKNYREPNAIESSSNEPLTAIKQFFRKAS